MRAVPIAAVVREPLIAGAVVAKTWRIRARVVRAEADVVEERKRGVDAVALVRSRRRDARRAAREQRADAAPPQDVALDADDREVRPLGLRYVLAARLDVHDADRVGASLAGQAAADVDRDDAVSIETDLSRVEQIRLNAGRDDRGEIRADDAAARKVEDTAPFEEEVALLGKEQVQARP